MLGAERLLGLTGATTMHLARNGHGRVQALVAGDGLHVGGVVSLCHCSCSLVVNSLVDLGEKFAEVWMFIQIISN